MRGKNGPRPRGPSIGSESMTTTLFNDDPLMHGLALFGNGGQLGLLSHTPPNFTPGSYEVSHMKRARAGSISGRLRSASDLEEKGLIDKSQKGVLKDLIISGDSELQSALDLYDNGDASQLEALMENGLLDRRESFDLLDNLDFGIMELGMSDEEPTTNSVTVDPVLMPVGAAHKSGVLGGDQSKVSPPPLPITTATTATAAAEKAASAASSSVSAFRNSGTVEEGTAAQASPVGGGEKNSSQGESGSGIQGSVGAGAAGGGSGVHASEQEIDLAGEGSGHFDIGEMAFDATFDHEYGEQEDDDDDNDDDVHMKDGTGQMPASSSSAASAGAAVAAAVVSTAVGPLRVVGSTSKNKLAPPNLISSRSAHRRDDNVGNDDARRPTGGERDGSEDDADGDDEDDDETDDSDSEGSQDGGGGGGGGGGAAGVVMSDDEGVGREGHGVDSDAPELGSFSTMGAVIGDFSPQFKFSFTDDIHLDLGGGLKDELRDLDSLSEHGPDHHGRGGDMMGLSASRAQQLLSRGGPALVKSEILSSPSSSQLGTTRSGTAAAAKASAAAAAAAAAADAGSDAAAAAANNGGYATNHYASGAAYHGRHTGPYATAAEAATGGVKAEIGSAAPSIQTRPHGSSAAAVAAAAAAATGGGDSASAGGLYGRDGAAAAAAATAGVAPTHHAARGRPVVSGMGIMVGGGPRIGVSGGADGGEKKFVGAYSPEARRQRIERFLQKREKRVWTKMVKYDVRKNFADTRMRVKGRFVKKEDEALLREVMACA